jgi:GSH-dependent disulfide-bond oxidoreductase
MAPTPSRSHPVVLATDAQRQNTGHPRPRWPLQRYIAEAKRLLAVLDRRLSEGTWIMGNDYGIADISAFPWVSNLIDFYNAGDLVGIADFTPVMRALKSFSLRPAVIRGNEIPRRKPSS